MWPAISIQSNEYVRSAIANCVCPECGGAIELHSSQKTVASYLGKHQARRRATTVSR